MVFQEPRRHPSQPAPFLEVSNQTLFLRDRELSHPKINGRRNGTHNAGTVDNTSAFSKLNFKTCDVGGYRNNASTGRILAPYEVAKDVK
jgi:hypothetical protein